MTKLHQIVAVESGIKSKTFQKITETHKTVQKAPLLSGISRTYTPKYEDGDQFPAEKTRVQVRATEEIKAFQENLIRLFDVTATKDWANTEAKADVVVKLDGGTQTILRDVPMTYLLFLEKQLDDIRTFVKKLPVLDPSEEWVWNEEQACYATPPVETVKTKKVPRNHVKAPATDKHPAQVDVYSEDVVIGTWKTIKFSGALPQTRIDELLERVDLLKNAVIFAREQANSLEVTEQHTGSAVFSFLFG